MPDSWKERENKHRQKCKLVNDVTRWWRTSCTISGLELHLITQWQESFWGMKILMAKDSGWKNFHILTFEDNYKYIYTSIIIKIYSKNGKEKFCPNWFSQSLIGGIDFI